MSALPPLVQAVMRLPPEWFAVVDGAYFDNLPLVLQTCDLVGLPLYLEGGAPEHRDAAGFLVDLPDEAAIRRLESLLAGRPAAVFWSWPLGRMALYRHLRTLNLVEIPNEAKVRAEAEQDPAAADLPAYESVLFRHWDPNVLGALLPLLTLAQRARFLGAATGLAFDAPDYAGLMAAGRPLGLPPAPRGTLRFSAEQMEDATRSRIDASNARIARYLRDVAPDHAARRSDTELARHIESCRKESAGYGVETERGIGQWSFLSLVTEGRFIHQPGVDDWLRQPPKGPDHQLDMLLASLAPAAKRQGRS